MMGMYDNLNYGGGGYTIPLLPSIQSGQPAPIMNMGQQAVAGATATGIAPVQPGANGGAPTLNGWQKFGTIMDAIGTLGNIYGGFQNIKLAKDQLALSKEAYNTNMNNTIKTYNTSLEDRIRARYGMEGRSSAEADAYLKSHSLSR